MTVDGLRFWRSAHPAVETSKRLKEALESARLPLFAIIDHAAAAHAVGLSLPFTEVLIFGSPSVGTPLMAMAPSIAIDLPLKALVWQDVEGQAWLGLTDPVWLGARHHLPSGADATLAAMWRLQAGLAVQATQ